MVVEEFQGVEVSHKDLLQAEYPQVHDPLPDIKTWSDDMIFVKTKGRNSFSEDLSSKQMITTMAWSPFSD